MTYDVYEDNQDEHEDNTLNEEDNLELDKEYIAKVLNYKNNLKSSKFVALLDYSDPCVLR